VESSWKNQCFYHLYSLIGPLSISKSFEHRITKFFNASLSHAPLTKLVQKPKANATCPFTFTKTSPERETLNPCVSNHQSALKPPMQKSNVTLEPYTPSHFRHEKALISELQANRKLFSDHLPSILHGGLVGAGSVWPTAKCLQGPSLHTPMESATTFDKLQRDESFAERVILHRYPFFLSLSVARKYLRPTSESDATVFPHTFLHSMPYSNCR
jgi:hypothetical protein